MLTYANHVGLFSEEIALNGEQIALPAGLHPPGTHRRGDPLDAALDALTRGHLVSSASSIPRSTTIERGPAVTRSPACRFPCAVVADGSNVSISATHS